MFVGIESLEMRQLMAGNRYFFIGNSMTDGLSYGGLRSLLNSATATTITYGRQTKPGGTLAGNYYLDLNTPINPSGFEPARPTVTNPFKYYDNAFTNYQWDAVSLQPNERHYLNDVRSDVVANRQEAEVPMTMKFMKKLAVKSPNAQVFIYSRPARRTDLDENQVPTGIAFDYSARWNGTYYDTGANINEEYYTRSAVKQIMPLMRSAQAADATLSKMPKIKLIPGGEAYYNIDQMIKAGKFNGTPVKSILNLYADHTHPSSNLGSYVLALTMQASLTGKDPRGMIVPSNYNPTTGPLANATVVKLVQQAVYDAIHLGTYSIWTNYTVVTPPLIKTASISGSIYYDKNKNGKWETGENAIAGRTVWIDLDNDGVKDTSEKSQVTNSLGKYTFSNLAAGTYKVREVIPTGWKQTFPGNSVGINVTITTGQIRKGIDFLVATV